ncbi:enoyl-CoA hydratase-related protein [Verticiella sediminum]|nr:enoyl-CoA hydratase-related protein [Verticiella sediminum]
MSHPSPGPSCQVHVEDGVARVRFENGKLNLLTEEAALIYADALRELQWREDIRLLEIRGGEAAFLGGADIKFLRVANGRQIDAYIRSVHALCEQIRALPFPTMSLIRGYCLGAGMEVACMCDIKLATRDATFGMPEVKLGVPTVIHGAMLPGMIGWTRTRDLLLTGRMIDADTAERWGLISAVTQEADIDTFAAHWRAELAEAGPRALRLQKSLLSDWEKMPLQAAIDTGIHCLVKAYDTDEPHDYMTRFLESRRRARA